MLYDNIFVWYQILSLLHFFPSGFRIYHYMYQIFCISELFSDGWHQRTCSQSISMKALNQELQKKCCALSKTSKAHMPVSLKLCAGMYYNLHISFNLLVWYFFCQLHYFFTNMKSYDMNFKKIVCLVVNNKRFTFRMIKLIHLWFYKHDCCFLCHSLGIQSRSWVNCIMV